MATQINVSNDGTKTYKTVVKVGDGETDPFAKASRGTRTTKEVEFEFNTMAVGDFFFVADEAAARKAYQAHQKNKAYEAARKVGSIQTLALKGFPEVAAKYGRPDTDYVVRMVPLKVKPAEATTTNT